MKSSGWVAKENTEFRQSRVFLGSKSFVFPVVNNFSGKWIKRIGKGPSLFLTNFIKICPQVGPSGIVNLKGTIKKVGIKYSKD